MMMCLHDVKEQFRSKIKYDDNLTEDEVKGWEDAREMFLGTLSEYNIDLNNL
jgi:hypothetical protein